MLQNFLVKPVINKGNEYPTLDLQLVHTIKISSMFLKYGLYIVSRINNSSVTLNSVLQFPDLK